MGHCLNCNTPLEDDAVTCPECGHEVAQGEEHSTLIYDEIPGTGTLLYDSEMLNLTAPLKEARPAEEPADNGGTGTVSAPGVRPGVRDEFEESSELDQTLDVTELDEEPELDDDHATIDAWGGNPQADVVAPSSTADTDDASKTHVAGIDPSLTEETEADITGTVLFSADMPQILKDGSHPSGDNIGTVLFPTSGSVENAKEKTVSYGSTAMEPGTIEAGSSGTEGRLKRLWDGVAGSSGNPMHSLQASGLQASDSIFERVATRKVVDVNANANFASDYQIINKLGEGAMGIVYSARQTTVDRVVAIKMAKPSFQQNEDSRRRFLYEAQITADLDHSNIVPIHELGANDEGMLFYSMKLVQGTEWSRVMRKKTREQNVEIFMKVADAIAFAHSKGVLHRDLKPENTMLGRFGEVFVTDWGTAINIEKDATSLAVPVAQGAKFIIVTDGSKFQKGDSIVIHDGEELYDQRQVVAVDDIDPNRLYLRKKLTRHYQPSPKLKVVKSINMAGTPCYMAPEMAGHDVPKLGKTSDIYVLGAILYDIVIGKAPHTGKSVTECLRAALDNKIVVVDNDDPLLKIAYKAMSTEPVDRYQSVEELQEAVREYRRHAESISLSDRSSELLELARTKGDYEMFSRATFGYRDAIELWPENQTAVKGLKEARLAFGEAAFKKGDYDLVLQTVDSEVAEEYALYNRAVAAKKKAENREKSLKILQRSIAAVVMFAVVGLSLLSLYAFNERNKAISAKDTAVKAETAAKLAADSERVAKELAIQKEGEAKAAAEQEKLAKEAAETAAVQEKLAKEAAETAAEQEKLAKLEAEKAQMLATQAAANETVAKNEAIQAANLAKLRAAEIQIGEYESSLALAKSQIESFALAEGKQNLDRLKNITSEIFGDRNPDFDTWGWQRINLLSNEDLPAAQIGSVVTATDFSAESNTAVVGTQTGIIAVLRYDANGLTRQQELSEPNSKITAVAIAPEGDEVVYGYLKGEVYGMRRWQLSQANAESVAAIGIRNFQRITFTLDGKKVLAGTNGGVWIWDRTNDWFSRKEPTLQVENIRGELTKLQSISPHQVFLTVQTAGKTVLGVLDHATGKYSSLAIPADLESEISAAGHTLVDNKIAIALNDNRFLVGTLAADGKSVTGFIDLEDKHRAQITQIIANGHGRMITASANEPVAHVWTYNDRMWQYETYLTGTPDNIAGMGLLAADQVLGVDVKGESIVWDVQRQKQRRRLQRQSQGESEKYYAPVQAVVSGASDGQALAIDNNGVVDLWSLIDGSTQRIDSKRWSYIGHTPGAELVDSAVDMERGVVVSAARLSRAEKKYLAFPDHLWEFCIWDLDSGAMQRRWTAASRPVAGQSRTESIEQRISLIDHGRKMLFASDNETRIVELDSGKESFLRSNFGSYFAVPHPQNASLLMLVKRSGAIRLFDLNDESSWEKQDWRYFALADPSDIPLQGTWSEDGQRFYLAFSTGGLAKFNWTGERLSLTWSSRRLEDDTRLAKLRAALSVSSGRVQSHLDLDLLVENTGAGESLHLAMRNRGLNPTTKLVSVRFDGQNIEPSLSDNKIVEEIQWLQVRDGQLARVQRIHDQLIVDMRRVRSSLRVNDHTFVSTNSADVFGLVDGTKQVVSYGRPRLVSATGSRDGKTIFVMLEDGAMWKFQVAEGDAATWQRLSYTATGIQQLQLSPDGTKLLLLGGIARIVDPISGATLHEVGEVASACWDAVQMDRLAICRVNGTLELFENGKTTQLAKAVDTSASKVIGLQFFTETWNDKKIAPSRHLLVHTEDANDGYLQFVAIDKAPEGALRFEGDGREQLQRLKQGSKVIASPTEGILVTGDPAGTVAVWFATPTYEAKPRQLFDLEGHRGAAITCLEFTSDGRTVITADDKNRLFAWLSTDPLNKKPD